MTISDCIKYSVTKFDITKAENRVHKLVDKFKDIVSDLTVLRLKVRTIFVKKIETGATKIVAQSMKMAERCEFPDSWKLDEIESIESERYDRDDPCKAVGQIAKGLENWSKIFTRNCRNAEKEFKFHNRMTERLKTIRNDLRFKMKCSPQGYRN